MLTLSIHSSTYRWEMPLVCSDAADELESAMAQVSEVAHQMSSTALGQVSGVPAAENLSITSSHSLGNQATWEVGPEGEPSVSESENEASNQDLGKESFPTDETSALKTEGAGRGGAVTEDYECVVVTAALVDGLEGSDGVSNVRGGEEEGRAHTVSEGAAHTPVVAAPGPGELYDTQALQSVVGCCDLPAQRATLEGSQVRCMELDSAQTLHYIECA